MNDFVLMLKKQLLRKELRMIRDNPRGFSTTFFLCRKNTYNYKKLLA